MLLKDKGFLERIRQGRNPIRWVQTNSSSMRCSSSMPAPSIWLDRRLSCSRCRINGNLKSVYVYSRPEWTALVTTKTSPINKVEDLKGESSWCAAPATHLSRAGVIRRWAHG